MIGGRAYLRSMPQKPLDLPMDAVKSFVKDMKAYFAESNPIKRDAIAARQARLLRVYATEQRQLRTSEVKGLLEELKDVLGPPTSWEARGRAIDRSALQPRHPPATRWLNSAASARAMSPAGYPKKM